MKVKVVDLYKEHNMEKQEGASGSLCCYLPYNTLEVNKDRLYPAVLTIPGGGYAFVSEREAEPIAMRYLSKGYAVFVLDYSVAPLKYPTAFLEAAMAMNYIRNNAECFGIDNSKVAAIGFSAGGHLCGCLATLFDDEVIHNAVGCKSEKVRPDAVILSYPVISSYKKTHADSFKNLCGDDDKLKAKLSLEKCVTKNSSPAFIWHTVEDASVPVKNSLLLANAYEECGVGFSLHIFERGGHGLSTADWASYTTDVELSISSGITKWIDMSVDWLSDRGIKIDD